MNRKKNITQSPVPDKDFVSAARDEVLNRIEKDYERFKTTHTFEYPTWLYGPPKGNFSKSK
jgi:biuret amidohydrolase